MKTGIVSRGPAGPLAPIEGAARRVTGRVVDEARQPVAGAEVWLGEKRTTSGRDGAYAFDGVTKLEAGVLARAGDRFGSSTRGDDVALRPGVMTTIRVTGDGQPLAGAQVRLFEAPIATSDRDGVVHVVLPERGGYLLSVTAPDRAAATMWRIDEDELAVELPRGVPVSGVVVGPDGAPVADATVEIPSSRTTFVTADARGAWDAGPLAKGRYTMRARSRTLGSLADTTVVVDGPRRDVRLEVAPLSQITGIVVDASGAPVAGAEVVAMSDRMRSNRAATDRDGRFTLLGLPDGAYRIGARTRRMAASLPELALAAHERVDLALVVDESVIAGVVVDERGAPVEHGRISLARRYGKGRGGFTTTSFASGEDIDARGHFELAGIEPGEWSITASRRDEVRWQFRADEQAVTTGTRDVKLVLPAPATLTGRVLVDGVPATKLAIALSTDTLNLGYPTIVRPTDGRFSLGPIRPGTAVVTLMAPGTKRRVVERVALDGTVDLGELALSPGITIRGVVRDANGAPVAHAKVELGRKEQLRSDALSVAFAGYFATTTDANGAYVLERVAPVIVRYFKGQFTASADHLRSVNQQVPDHDATVDFVLVEGGGIDGKIVGPRPKAIFARATDTPVTATVDASGAFRFDDLTPGTYTLTADQVTATVTVVSGKRAAISLQMP